MFCDMNKKVALYLSGIGTGGIESVTISQFLYMDKSDLEVEFLVDTMPSNNFNVERIKKSNGIIRSYSTQSKSLLRRKFLKPICFIKTVRSNHYDIIHFRFSHPASLIYAFLCKLFCRTKVVVTSESQGSAHFPFYYRLLCFICSRLLPSFCDVRLADSKQAGIWMFGNCSFSVMADGFDSLSKKYSKKNRDELRKKLMVNPDETLIGHIGRFAPEKNQSFIINVFERYHNVYPNSKLLLIGQGSLRDTIIAKCKTLGIYDNCIFIESVGDIDAFYSAMDLFLFPSICEGFGMVAAEAQAASLPVLASRSVPNETCQTDIMRFEDLDAPITKWIEDIQFLLAEVKDRDNIDLSNLYNNCDIRNISLKLTDIYMNL